MMRYIRATLASFVLVVAMSSLMSLAHPTPAYAACSERLLTFPAWYAGLLDGKCSLKKPANSQTGLAQYVTRIILNVTDTLLQVVGYVSAGYVIYGGFKYFFSAGSPDGMQKAKNTVQNALVGLVISIFSIAIVNLVINALGGA